MEPVTFEWAFRDHGIGEKFLDKLGNRSRQLVFELTEGMKLRDFGLVKRAVSILRRKAAKFAIDDVAGFGPKLEKLFSLRPDFIKIDVKVIDGIVENITSRRFVKNLVRLSGRYGFSIVAEGIERARELKILRRLGIPMAQGFYFARPQKFSSQGLQKYVSSEDQGT